MNTAVKAFTQAFYGKSAVEKLVTKERELAQFEKNNGVRVTAVDGDSAKKHKELQKILKESFSIPISVENKTIGYAKAVEFVRFYLKQVSDESYNYVKSEFKEDRITISYAWPYLHSDPNIGSGEKGTCRFLFVKELVSDNYRKDASFNERLMRSGEKLSTLLNHHMLSDSALETLVRDFEKYIRDERPEDSLFSYKVNELFQGYRDTFLDSTYSLSKEFVARINPKYSARNVAFSNLINHNLNLIDVKFIQAHSTVKLRGLDKQDGLGVLKQHLFDRDKSYSINTRESWAMRTLKLTQEDRESLDKQMLRFINYSDDCHELQVYVNRVRKIKDKKVYSHAEISAVTVDSIYEPYRSSKLVKEFKDESIKKEHTTYFYENLMNVNPDIAIEMLPEMGKYFIDEITPEQRTYVKAIIKSLANRLDTDSSILDDSLTDAAIVAKAKELVQLSRYQNKESSLIYGRQACKIFLAYPESKIKLMENANYDSVIEHGKRLDNILIGLIVGLARV